MRIKKPDLKKFFPSQLIVLVVLVLFNVNNTEAATCQETASSSGKDNDPTITIINSITCQGGGTITAMTLDASIGSNCPSWYAYDIYINGSLQYSDQCNQTGLDISAWLPITSVELRSKDKDAYAPGDNVTLVLTLNITYTPTCNDPTALTTGGITPTTTDLSWTENGTASTWDIELGTAGFSPTGTPTSNNVTSNPYTNTGLSPSTSYDFYVRSDCGGLQSNWVGPLNFSTIACNIQTPTGLSVTPASTSAYLSWTENGNSTVWDIAVGTVGFSPTVPTGNGNDVTTNTNFNYSGGLSQGTTYEWYVRAVCNSSNGSWSSMGTFTTLTVSIECFVETMSSSAWNDQAKSVVYDATDDSYVWAGWTSDATMTAGNYDFYVVKTDIEGTVTWAKVIGSTGEDKAYDITTSHDGGYVILGTTNSASLLTAGSDAGDRDMMVIKLDASGNLVWTRVLGTDENDLNEDCSIIRTSDNGFAIAAQAAKWTTGSKHVIHFHKLNSSGVITTTKEIDPSTTNVDGANAIIQTSDGGFVIAGHNNYDHFVVKLKSDYTFDWSLKWTGPSSGSMELHAIVENAADNYSVFGYTKEGPASIQPNMYAMRFDYDGTGPPTVAWEKSIGSGGAGDDFQDRCYDAVSSGDGGYVLAGYTDVLDDNEFDTYLLKLDGSGNLVWETLIPSASASWDDRRKANGIFQDQYGGYAVAGRSSNSKFEMLRADPSGTNCLSSAHTGLITDIATAPTFTIDPGTFTASTRTVTEIGRTPTIANGGTVNQECIVVLPITLSNIETNCNKSTVVIEWTTSSEINNDYFTIERSEDGKSFEPIGIVSGAGNSSISLDYFFIDDTPLNGVSYYRLKQTDFDGKFSYSKIVDSDCKTNSESYTSIYPNPAKDQLTFTYNNSAKTIGNLNINIINPLGKIMLEKYYTPEQSMRKTLDISKLSNGIYQVIFITNSNKEIHKLVVNH